MTVHIYRSTDASAPVLDGTAAGSLITVLKACLVNGFGSGATATPAGWTLTLEDTVNKKAMFRNSTSTSGSGYVGSGRYFVFRDDGQQYISQGANRFYAATITGANNYTDINTLTLPFPRTISGTDRHNDLFYGMEVLKGTNAASPWIVIADEYTCYLITTASGNSTLTPAFSKLMGFGDVVKFGNVDNNPKAFVGGAMFATDGDIKYHPSLGLGMNLNNGAPTIQGYLEHSITNNSGSVSFYTLLPEYWNTGRAMVEAGTNGTPGAYIPWISGGSPITGGLVATQVTVSENPADVLRTYTHTYIEMETFAYLPGYYRCGHVIGFDPYKIGDDLDIVQTGGRDYLLVRISDVPGYYYNADHGYMFDITGPWR